MKLEEISGNLLKRYLTTILAVGMSGILLVSLLYYRKQQTQIKSVKENELTALADLKVNQVVDWKKERMGDALFILNDLHIAASVARNRNTEMDNASLTDGFHWMRSMYKNNRYESMLFFNPAKKILYSIPENTADHSENFTKEMILARSEDRIVFSDLMMDKQNKISLHIIIPVVNKKSNENTFLGWIVLCVNPAGDLFPLIQSWQMSSTTAEALLVRKEGDSVLFLNELRHLKNTAMRLKFPMTASDLPAVRAIQGHEGIFEGVDYRGVKVLSVTRKVPDSPWLMVAKIDKKEYMSDLRRVSNYILVFALLVAYTLAAFYALIISRYKSGIQRAKMQLDFERKLLATRYNYLSQFANDAIILANDSQEIIEVNDKAVEMYGYSHEEITGMQASHLRPPEHRAAFKEAIRQIRLSGREKYETMHQRKDGACFPVEVSIAYIQLEDHYYFQTIVRDITDRKEDEKKITHANRLYAFLSQVNQAILQIKDPQQLFKIITRIAVDTGKFKMAFTGLIDESTGRIIPHYYSGKGKDNPDENITTMTGELSDSGLLETVLRTGKLAVCNDMAKEPRKHFLHTRSMQGGYHSAAVIPLKRQKKVIGVLTLYAEESGFFTETETSLLEEIGNDIAFAVDSIDALKTLTESEERFRTFIEHSSEGIMQADEQGTVIEWNKAMENITGWTREQTVGLYFWEVQLRSMTPENIARYRDGYIDNMKEVSRTGRSEYFTKAVDVQLITAKGENKSVLQMTFPIKTDTGYRIGSMIYDITDRKLAEEALARERSLLLTLINNLPDVVYVKDIAMRKILTNRADLDLIGKQEAEVLGMTDRELFPSEIADMLESDDQAVLTYGKTLLNREEMVINSKGERIWLLTSKIPLYDTERKISGLVGIGHDITDRKKAEFTLRESERKLREAQEMAHLGFWFWDIKTGFVEWSDEVYKIFGLNPKEFTPHIDSILALSPWPEDHQRDRELISRAMESHRQGHYEQRFLRPDQSIGYYYSTFQGNYDDHGDLISIVGTILDITERKQAELSLRNLSLRQEALLYAVPEIIMEVDNNKIYRWANKHGLEFFGDDVIGREASYYFDGEQNTYETVQPLFNGSENLIYVENWQRRRDGEKRLLAWCCTTLKDGNGDVTGALSSARDITEFEKTEELLKTSEIRYRRLFESAKDGILILNAETGRIEDANPFIKNLLGYTRDEIMGMELWEIGLFRDIFANRESFTALQKNEYIRYDDLPLKSLDGRTIDVEFISNVYLVNKHKVIQCNIRDITERKRAEKEIFRLNAELEQRVTERTAELSDLYNNAPCGYHSLDNDGLIVRINDTELHWLGYSRDEIEGKKRYSDLLKDESIREFEMNFPVFKKQGWISDLEFDMMRKDGSILPVVLSATAITDSEGNYLMSRSTIIDNTERKQAEETMFESQQKLEYLNRELEAFAYSVSHDLRAPLRAIDGFTHILLEEYSPKIDMEGQRICSVISENAVKMGQLIDDLLAFSRLNRSAINYSNIDMKTMADKVFNEIAEPGRKSMILFELQELPPAFCDASLLKQVWINLLSNAIKYSRKCKNPAITVGYDQSETETTYSVKDNGVGFEQEYAGKLFGVFQRLHKSEEFEGTGVGLAIVKRIIDRHGGRVWAEGEINKGAAFYFTLPHKK